MYRVKWQPTNATSSTEADIITAVSATKAMKHMCEMLKVYVYPQDGPTMIYKDNVATILMANDGNITERACHIDIQYLRFRNGWYVTWTSCITSRDSLTQWVP